MARYCARCRQTLKEQEFYKSNNTEKYPQQYVNLCKKCMTAHVDNWNPETYVSLLEELDVPYVPHVWNSIIEKYCQDITKVDGTTVLGRYLSQMRMVQWNKYRYTDTEKIKQQEEEKKLAALRQAGLTEEEIAATLLEDAQSGSLAPPPPPPPPAPETPEIPEEKDELMDELDEADKIYLKLKWGEGYRAAEWVKMEQLYNDMMESYDIQTAGHKDTLIMICKASLKANQAIDAGDFDGFQKMSRVYDNLMKSGKFTAAQTKAEEGEFVNCVGELVEVCEKEGFIPRYYVDTPQDKIDRVLEDYQTYVRKLIVEEMGLGDMIENALVEIEKDREREAIVSTDDDETNALEHLLYKAEESKPITAEDQQEFSDFVEAGMESGN